MNESTINTRYAKALLKLAREKKELDRILDDMKTVYDVFSNSEEIEAIMADPVMKTSKKTDVLSTIFKSNIAETSLAFLNLIVKNKRESHIRHIARYFLDLVKKEQGIKSVLVTTASQLDIKQKTNFQEVIKAALNSEIELTEKIDQDIIGGFIIRIDDTQYDSSVKTQLMNIKKDLVTTTIEK